MRAAAAAPNAVLLRHAPAFFCGAAFAWSVQCIVGRTSTLLQKTGSSDFVSDPGSSPMFGGGCVQLRTMAEALHAEVEVARRLLAECREDLQVSTSCRHTSGLLELQARSSETAETPGAIPTSTLDERTAPEAAVGFDIRYPDRRLAERRGGGTDDSQSSGMLTLTWTLVLLVLDVGLLYFCLEQCMPPAAIVGLEALLVGSLEVVGVLQAPSAAYDGSGAVGCKHGEAGDSCCSGRQNCKATKVDPCLSGLLVRRPARKELAATPERQRTDRIRYRVSVATLGLTSLVGAALLRLVAHATAAAGWRFLGHLFAYALITARVCLAVLLILF